MHKQKCAPSTQKHPPTASLCMLQGEPLIVQLGWAATCVMFTFSISMVVWGRSGM
jgi:cytochrome b6-f complex subunit 8